MCENLGTTIRSSQSCYFVLVYTELFTWYNSNIVLKKINLNHAYPWEFHDLLQFLGQGAIQGAEPPQVAGVPGGTWSPSRLGRTAGQQSSTSSHNLGRHSRPHP